jgi:hypothetical protein
MGAVKCKIEILCKRRERDRESKKKRRQEVRERMGWFIQGHGGLEWVGLGDTVGQLGKGLGKKYHYKC